MPYNVKDYTPFREGKHPVFSSSENGCRHIGNNVRRQHIRHFKVDGVQGYSADRKHHPANSSIVVWLYDFA